MFNKYLKELIILAFPILLGNIGQILITIGDVYIAGKFNTDTLAAISVASAIFFIIIISGLGILGAITPVLANYRGEKKFAKKYFGITVLFTQILGLFFFILTLSLSPLIKISGINPNILQDTIEYIQVSAFSVFGIFLYAGLKEFLQSYEKVIFPNLLMGLAVILNLILNYYFVIGYGNFKGFGTIGIAISSLIVRVFLGLVLLLYTFKYFKGSIYKNTFPYVKDLIKVGFPIGGALFIEYLGFNIVAILIGRLESFYTAAHEIILSIASLTYMFPFSLSQALSVKTGYANGAKDINLIKTYILQALYFTVIYSIIVAILYFIFKYEIISFFTNDTSVINEGVKVIIIVACYTLFDCFQGIFTGALKGIKKTKDVFFIMLISHILVSIPTGLFLGFKMNLKLQGFWIGLALGLFSAGIMSLILLVKNLFKLNRELKSI